MTRTFLLIGLLACSFCSAAKEHSSAHKPLITQNQLQTDNRTTAMQERLVAYSYRRLSSPATVLDTISYYYSNGRGSNPMTISSTLVPEIEAPTFQNIRCDSFINKVSVFTHGVYTYNAQNQAIEYQQMDTAGSLTGTLVPSFGDFYSYNAANQLTEDSSTHYSGSVCTYHFYDVTGYLVLDSQYSYSTHRPAYTQAYVNDLNGNHLSYEKYEWGISGGGVPNSRTSITYDGFGHQVVGITELYSGGVWVNYGKDSIYYPGAGNLYTCTVQYYWDSIVWVQSDVNLFHINSANLWDTVWYTGRTATIANDTVEKDYQAYDAYGNLQYVGGIAYNSTTRTFATTPYDLNIYYYETYTPASVNKIAKASVSVSVYPNPVSHILYVSLHDAAANQKAKVTITNLPGQKMRSGEVNGSDISCFDMSAMAPGIYIVSVSGDGLQYTQKIVKE